MNTTSVSSRDRHEMGQPFRMVTHEPTVNALDMVVCQLPFVLSMRWVRPNARMGVVNTVITKLAGGRSRDRTNCAASCVFGLVELVTLSNHDQRTSRMADPT